MDHERAQSLFTSYHEKELSFSDVAALEEHLSHCAECRSAWQGYQATVEEVSGLLKVAPAADFSRRVQQTIGRRSQGRFFSSDADTGGMGVAIVSVIFVLVFALLYLLVAFGGEVEVIDPERVERAGTSAD